jgi:hypothetical protein
MKPFIFRQVINICQSYYELIAEKESIDLQILNASNRSIDGQPRGNGTSNPTEEKALKLCEMKKNIDKELQAVDQALITFADDERELLKENVLKGVPIQQCFYMKCERSAQDVRKKFFLMVKENLGL